MPFARKSLLLTFLILGVLALQAQEQEQYILVKGSVLNAGDSMALTSTSISIERLPYYDKQFRAATDGSGNFELYLAQGSEYNVLIQSDGFEMYNQSIKVVDEGNEIMGASFYVIPIAEPEPEPEPVEPEPVEEEIFLLENLIFSSGSDVIQRSSYTALDEFAAWLKARPSYIVQLEGHTDTAGNPDANMRLSQARVESVKEYIRKKGIKRSRVLTKAFGGTQPLSAERTDAAKRANRRVEVRVVAR